MYQLKNISRHNLMMGGGLYDFISRFGNWIASRRTDPRKGLTIPIAGNSYCGPLNNTDAEYQRDYPVKTQTESVCKQHDLNYDRCLAIRNTAGPEAYNQCIANADQLMLGQLTQVRPQSTAEALLKQISQAGIATKAWIDQRVGAGLKKRTKSKYGLY